MTPSLADVGHWTPELLMFDIRSQEGSFTQLNGPIDPETKTE